MSEALKIIQHKTCFLGISPMIWRRILEPSTTTLRELHRIIQVAMGWERIHLFQFNIHAIRNCFSVPAHRRSALTIRYHRLEAFDAWNAVVNVD